MAIKLPELDDKTYADLVAEARTAISAVYPAWTDHNPSDPGIALIEMFAWLIEMIVYRTGRIPEKSERAFLGLLNGGKDKYASEALADARAKTLQDLRERYRAVTPDDYEHLTVLQWIGSKEAVDLGKSASATGLLDILRAHCIPECRRDAQGQLNAARGHVLLVVMPHRTNAWTARSEHLAAVHKFIAGRHLIATQVDVVDVKEVAISLEATVHLRDDARTDNGAAAIRTAIQNALLAHFHPITGGPAGRGWPFGRDVDLSDVLAVMDAVAGVEFVDTESSPFKLQVVGDVQGQRNVTADGKLLGLRIEPDELPCFAVGTMALTLMERRGNRWQLIPIP